MNPHPDFLLRARFMRDLWQRAFPECSACGLALGYAEIKAGDLFCESCAARNDRHNDREEQ